MSTLVVGASGATGQLLVKQLLNRGQMVKIIVRSPDKLPEFFRNNDNLHVINASVLDLSDTEMTDHVNECKTVASCLGHNMSIKGLYGHPQKLVSFLPSQIQNPSLTFFQGCFYSGGKIFLYFIYIIIQPAVQPFQFTACGDTLIGLVFKQAVMKRSINAFAHQGKSQSDLYAISC
jgi:hypothetical protein